MTPLDAQAQRPLHLQLADELRSAIRRGELRPGQRLPSERELVDRYQTSRTTVRLALGVLKTEALIASGHGRGTFVRAHPPVRLEFARFTRRRREPGLGPWQAATRRAGVAGSVEVIAVDRTTADAELAHRLGVDEGAEVIVCSRHMLADGVVVQLYDGYYPADLFQGTELDTTSFISGGIYAAFDRLGHHPKTATEEVGARAPTPEEVALLRLGIGVPVLTVIRSTRNGSGRVIEVLKVIASAEAILLIYEDLPLA